MLKHIMLILVHHYILIHKFCNPLKTFNKAFGIISKKKNRVIKS